MHSDVVDSVLLVNPNRESGSAAYLPQSRQCLLATNLGQPGGVVLDMFLRALSGRP